MTIQSKVLNHIKYYYNLTGQMPTTKETSRAIGINKQAVEQAIGQLKYNDELYGTNTGGICLPGSNLQLMEVMNKALAKVRRDKSVNYRSRFTLLSV